MPKTHGFDEIQKDYYAFSRKIGNITNDLENWPLDRLEEALDEWTWNFKKRKQNNLNITKKDSPKEKLANKQRLVSLLNISINLAQKYYLPSVSESIKKIHDHLVLSVSGYEQAVMEGKAV